jgi:hypothetical protein
VAVWALIAAVTFYAWETSNFQVLQSVHEGGPWLVRNAVELGLPVAVVLLALLTVAQHARKAARFSLLGRAYLWLGAFTLLVTLVWGAPAPARLMFQGMVFALIMDMVLQERGRLVRFLWGNAVVGVTCVMLNTVPVLQFARLITLPTTYVERMGGGWEASGVKILSFGVFGRSEWNSYPLRGVWFNRLHGWSFEPIHWAYFVLWTAVCCLLLLSQPLGQTARRSLRAALALLFVHLYFVFSAAAFLVVALSAALVLWHRLASVISPKLSRAAIYLVVVLGGGLVGPIALAVTPAFTQMITEETVFSKGDNWESKVAFVRLGPQVILTRVVPDPEMAEGAGHNLVLSTYLAFGVFGVLPLLVFEWRLLKFTLHAPRRSVQAAALLSLAAINHQVPWMLYYPLGAIWVVTLGHAARLASVRQAPVPVPIELTLAKTA